MNNDHKNHRVRFRRNRTSSIDVDSIMRLTEKSAALLSTILEAQDPNEVTKIADKMVKAGLDKSTTRANTVLAAVAVTYSTIVMTCDTKEEQQELLGAMAILLSKTIREAP